MDDQNKPGIMEVHISKGNKGGESVSLLQTSPGTFLMC